MSLKEERIVLRGGGGNRLELCLLFPLAHETMMSILLPHFLREKNGEDFIWEREEVGKQQHVGLLFFCCLHDSL